ncbi:NADH:flavin oxidoreductase/NADH oxidase [Sphingomonas baiyangensis]|uniref:NADH:flavin oxidoreductase/NADH oxidase n=1 Tax=Sphingomonas baiyangensis TaxID=2572576 RepID=A0A4V5PY66_9SPHN|nr:NADH:flavin oxidoreductase/NADH oxidase [Sphingomonas baiyangensis]TKD49968.1 NADH:flavin oxidoreductase/NADH oxidase [Sphingomonas baiyangensis]
MSGTPALFTPFALRGVTFANRIVVSPMCQYAADDGYVGRWHRSHHGRFALSGVGGAVVESTGVTREGRITPGCLGIYLDAHVEGLREITAIYRDQGVPVGIQLNHAGRKASAAVPLEGAQPLATSDPARAWPIVAPSAEPLTPDWPVPEALSEDAIAEIIEAFVAAARRAVDAGFDFIEIHGAHGYLLHSFVSPIANRRNDGWGGDLAGRMRLPVEIARRIRAEIPADMPLFYRASAIDGVEGGLAIEDSVALAKALKTEGVDLIDCSSGGIHGASGNSSVPPAPGYLVEHAARIRKDADMPTMAVGLIVDPQQAEAVIAAGEADLVAMGRQLLAEPSFPYRAARELDIDDPAGVLPPAYAFFLRRRKVQK